MDKRDARARHTGLSFPNREGVLARQRARATRAAGAPRASSHSAPAPPQVDPVKHETKLPERIVVPRRKAGETKLPRR
jgi:hypothetical protein